MKTPATVRLETLSNDATRSPCAEALVRTGMSRHTGGSANLPTLPSVTQAEAAQMRAMAAAMLYPEPNT